MTAWSMGERQVQFSRGGATLFLVPTEAGAIDARGQALREDLLDGPTRARTAAGPAVRRLGQLRAEARAAADEAAEAAGELAGLDQRRAEIAAAAAPGWSAEAAALDRRRRELLEQSEGRAEALAGPLADARAAAEAEVEEAAWAVTEDAAAELRERRARRLERIAALLSAELTVAVVEEELAGLCVQRLQGAAQGRRLADGVNIDALADRSAAESTALAR